MGASRHGRLEPIAGRDDEAETHKHRVLGRVLAVRAKEHPADGKQQQLPRGTERAGSQHR